MSQRIHPLTALRPNAPKLARLLLVGPLLLTASGATAQDWIDFVDVTASRLSATDPQVGINDTEEQDLTSGDVDRDGDIDIIVVRKTPFTNPGGRRNVLFLNENGVMTDRTASLAPDFLDLTDDRDVELADVDGDLWLDIITAGTFNEQPRILMNLGEIRGVWQGFEYDDSRLPVLESTAGDGPFFCGLGVGDLTGNGLPDLYFSDYGHAVTGQTPPTIDLEDRLLINNGSGFFADETTTRLAAGMAESQFGTDADIGDMNGDGFNDIIKTDSSGSNPGSPTVSILYNDGTGNFTFQDFIYTDAPYMVAPIDFTQDGRLDLVIVDDAQDAYLINTGNDGQGHAEFSVSSVSPSPRTNFFGGNVKFADLDIDGLLDVLIADVDTDIPGCNGSLSILKGQGTPPNVFFSDLIPGGESRPWLPNGTFDIEPFDLNGDSQPDLWVSTCTGTHLFMGVTADVFADGFESGNTSAWSASVP